MSWGDPGVTEQQMILEDSIMCPGADGGVKTQTLQRAGYLKKLRIMAEAEIEQSAASVAPGITPYGPFAGLIKRIRIEAAGRQPLFVASGHGASIYNEIQNKDGSVLATPTFGATYGIVGATPLVEYTAPGTVAQSYAVKFPLEATMLRIERELYAVPADPKDRPPEMWAHQVTEYEEAIAGKKFRFDIPAAGLILRAVMVIMDANGALVEYTDIENISIIYGTNTTPIRRPGWAMVQEYLQDYGRYPPKGVVVNDLYKWGMDTLKLAKDSEALANFRIEGTFTATTSGTALIILDTLQRVLRAGAG